jgi:hypothetical protein
VILLALLITYNGFIDESSDSLKITKINSSSTLSSITSQNNTPISLPAVEEEVKDGVIHINKITKVINTIANPFKKYSIKKPNSELIRITVGGLIESYNPEDSCVIINERPFSKNDLISGLLITKISNDFIILKYENHLIRIPINDNPISISIEDTTKT